ncbi:trigger factor [Candidatus Poribacteria bacterium]|nr:trigger factor [Candidatus Poribacteria bacterium]MYF56151.1 trigger factor [Candidatus Poribacteria bacterium]
MRVQVPPRPSHSEPMQRHYIVTKGELNLRVEVETLDNTQAKLDIEVPAEDINEALEEAYKTLRGHVTLPGFRKGRVPLTLLKSRFPEYINNEVVRMVVFPAYEDALYNRQIVPLAQPTFDPPLEKMQVTEDQPLVFTATVSVKPVIELPDYKNIQIDKTPVNVPREDVDAFIAQLQDQSATFDPIQEDRPVNVSDCVRLDYTCILEGSEIESESDQDIDIDLTDERYHPDLINGIIGMHIGETKAIAVNFDEAYHTPELRNKQVIYNVILHAITQKHLPELDDEFAKDLGYETYNQLHGVIWNNMVEDARIQQNQEQKVDILEQLIEMTNITIPDDVVDQYVQNAIENVRKQLKDNNQTPEQAGVDFEVLPTEMRRDVIQQTKQNWIFEEIATYEDIHISDDELENGIRRAADIQGRKPDKLSELLKENNRLEDFRIQLEHEKIYQFLIQEASEKKSLIITG